MAGQRAAGRARALGPPAPEPDWLAAEERPIVLLSASTEFQDDAALIEVGLAAVAAEPYAVVARRLRPDRLRAAVAAAITRKPGAERVADAFRAAGGPARAASELEGQLPSRRTLAGMCRLFALHAGERNVAAEFWLLDAPDSIARQSEVNADGYGLAALTAEHGLILMKNPVEAAGDAAYQQVARRLVAAEMLVHLRYADTGGTSLANTHPFLQDGRVFAHNGVVGDLERLERRLGENRAMVMGETDSERFFALITLSIREAGGDVEAGIRAAVAELADDYELYSLNFVLGERGRTWAFRYPEHNPLHLLRREPGGGADRKLDHADGGGTMRIHSDDGAEVPMVVIASEPVSEEPGWDEIASGELVSVGPDLVVEREMILSEPPRYPMVLSGRAELSQAQA